jgi:hypothetical protein
MRLKTAAGTTFTNLGSSGAGTTDYTDTTAAADTVTVYRAAAVKAPPAWSAVCLRPRLP